MRHTRSPASQVACKLLSGLSKLGVTPGGGGIAPDVGEEAIVKAVENRSLRVEAGRYKHFETYLDTYRGQAWHFSRSPQAGLSVRRILA